jgi:DNA-binding Lrp family transcriptional regulator
MPGLNALQRNFINLFQGGFPLTERPFSSVAALLGTTEASLIPLIQQLLDDKIISRFGPFFNAERLGGAFTLAAMRVPEARFEKTTKLVNSMDAVAHNYQREHALNMWFVIAADRPSGITDCIAAIEQATGISVFNFPKLQEFYLGLKLHLDDGGDVDTVPMHFPELQEPHPLDDLDKRIIGATQAGLPLEPHPYTAVARQVHSDTGEVIMRMQRMLDSGMIRRIGVAPNHYRLGLKANGMTVWNVADEQLQKIGQQMGALDYVSHCYERPRRLPHWPYNLFAMIHGTSREQVYAKLDKMKHTFPHQQVDVLFSSAILKKTGMRIAA